MNKFIQQHQKKINGVLNGFDRLVIRGTLRSLAVKCGMIDFLNRIGVLLKDFGSYVEKTTGKLKEASYSEAKKQNRPIKYLSSPKLRKDMIAKEIARNDNIKTGLICILTSVELCMSYKIYKNKKKKKLELEPHLRKCLFIYHYWIDEIFGFMNARIQTWFPFSIQICLNGREWLSRQMDSLNMKYVRMENCFPDITNLEKAQSLMNEQLNISWPKEMNRFAKKLNPAHDEIFNKYKVDYYWSVHQSEWATDIMFKTTDDLAAIYHPLTTGAISKFSSPDVMRFLGKKLNGNFLGELSSDYKNRKEGVRVKHSIKGNSVKVYDKQGRILRVETTINNPREFKVYRPIEEDPHCKNRWQKMRKGVADIYRRAEISQKSNERYLDALSSLNTDANVKTIIEPVCLPTKWKNNKVRALRPWAKDDFTLFISISRGEFNINGFRNKDISKLLYPDVNLIGKEKKHISGRITRKFRMLRAHHLIKKVPHTYRYILTKKGHDIISAILKFQDVTVEQLNKAAA